MASSTNIMLKAMNQGTDASEKASSATHPDSDFLLTDVPEEKLDVPELLPNPTLSMSEVLQNCLNSDKKPQHNLKK
jgi:hypothetical protein